jgi:hypothetical protein
MTMQELAHRLVRPDHAVFANCMVRMGVGTIDRLWKEDEHIPEGEFNNEEVGVRARTFLEEACVSKNPFVYAPILFFDGSTVRFGDGNHRFVVFRDEGVKSIDVATTATMRGMLWDAKLIDAMIWQMWKEQQQTTPKE